MKLIPWSLTLIALCALGWCAAPADAGEELRWHVCHRLSYVSNECLSAPQDAEASRQAGAGFGAKVPEERNPPEAKPQEPERPPEKQDPVESKTTDADPSPRPPWYFVNPDAPPAMQSMLSKENPTEEDAEKAIEELMLIMNRTNVMTELLYRAGIKKGFIVPPMDDFSAVRMGGPEGTILPPNVPAGSPAAGSPAGGPGAGDVMIPYYASKPTLLYFYNPSCGACARTTPEILSLDARTRNRVDIVAVVATPEQASAAGAFPFRVEVRPDLYAVLDVDRTPTFVMFDRDTKKAARWSGVTSAEEFRYWIGAVLAERERQERGRPARKRRGVVAAQAGEGAGVVSAHGSGGHAP